MGASNGIYIDSGVPTIDSVAIQNVVNGIYILNGDPLLQNNVIINASSNGIWIDGTTSSPTLSGNIVDGAATGLFIDVRSVPILSGNSFINVTKQVVVPVELVDKVGWAGNGISTLNLASGYNMQQNTTFQTEPWKLIIDSDIVIDAGVTLSINPGYILEFANNFNDIFVNGTLTAIGTEVDSIFFIGSNPIATTHGGMINFTPTSSGSQIDYVSFQKMGDSNSSLDAILVIETSDVSVSNVRLFDSESAGIRVRQGANPTFGVGNIKIDRANFGVQNESGSPTYDSLNIKNVNYGFFVQDGNPVITRNSITAGTGNQDGILIRGTSLPSVTNNTITGFSTGIFIDARTVPTSHIKCFD